MKKQSKTAVVWNPSAGGAGQASEILRILQSQSEVTVYQVEAGQNIEVAALKAAKSDASTVIAAGGDGTIHIVATTLLQHAPSTSLGILPLGTGNDFARSLDIPLDNEQALEIALSGVSVEADVVHTKDNSQEYIFLNLAAGGAAGTINKDVDPEHKRILGPLAYAVEALTSLHELERYDIRASFDGLPEEEHSVLCVVIANGSSIAGGLPLAPRASVFDGFLDVLLIQDSSFFEIFSMAADLISGQIDLSDGVIYRNAKNLSLESQPPMRFSLDGEYYPRHFNQFWITPSALKVKVAAKPERENLPDPL